MRSLLKTIVEYNVVNFLLWTLDTHQETVTRYLGTMINSKFIKKLKIHTVYNNNSKYTE